ncbi:MAG: AIR carboxylase family protein [Candidatus Berkelbacteria bacterium]|nr:AIR carboxylase family protein [Candidatus Berkelbacteria bacterium]
MDGLYAALDPVEVVVIEGSESDDWLILDSKLPEIFAEVGINYRVTVASAHRHACQGLLPDYLKFCWESGTREYVGIAGMAAVLPGIIAANLSEAIVYGVPVPNEKDFLRDLAALLAIIESPPGTVVRCCGRGPEGLTNTALAICQDFSIPRSNPKIYAQTLAEYRQTAAKKKPMIPNHTPQRK